MRNATFFRNEFSVPICEMTILKMGTHFEECNYQKTCEMKFLSWLKRVFDLVHFCIQLKC